MTFVSGLDISYSAASQAWFQARLAEGYQVFVQDLWTGGFQSNNGIKAVAETNLRNARLAGYVCAGYANAAPPTWWPDEVAVNNSKKNAGLEWDRITDIVIDIEIDGTTWERVFSLAAAFEAEGKRVCIYTGKWVIDKMGQPSSMPYKLWTTGKHAYAPWTEADVIGHQLGETTTDGVTYDYDDFDLDFFQSQEDDMTVYEQEAGAALTALTDGEVIRGRYDYQVYVVEKDAEGNRRKRHITDSATAQREGIDLTHVTEVPALTIALLKPGDDIG